MSKNRRLQIPVSLEDESLFKSAAQVYNIPAAEWARRVLKKAAIRDLSSEVILDPISAVAAISQLNAPVDSVSVMKSQSFKGK